MSNPLLNEKRLEQAATANDSGWAAPDQSTRQGNTGAVNDGPTTPWVPTGRTMTVAGTASATAVLFLLLLAAAVVGWLGVDAPQGEVYKFPAYAIGGLLVGFVLAIVLAFKPHLAKFLAPVYAIAEGLFVGAISKAYETYYDGIVVQAAGATIGVFVVMLAMYSLRIIKVTDRFRRIVIGATLGLAAFYLFSFIAGFFGANLIPSGSSTMSIGFSVLVAGLAAMNLALDFDFIDKAEAAGAPKHMEWFAALGIMVTLVWLYLEILRLLAKMRDR